MSAQKNKNRRLDLDKREQNKSVVQRFITSEAPVLEEQNNAASNILTAQKERQADISPNVTNIANTTDTTDMPNIIHELVNPLSPSAAAPAALSETAEYEYNTQTITAQLEKLESRLEKLDKLDELDRLANLEQKLNENLERKPAQEPPKYILFNAMEEAVREEVRATLNNVNVCKCDKCYYDICALVLNNMIPQYATSQEGVLMKKAKTLLNMEILTKLSSEIFSAIDKVRNKPGHNDHNR